MAESISKSIPGVAPMVHEAGDTFVRTITIKSGGVVIDLSGSTIEVLVSVKEDGEPIVGGLLTAGNGIATSDLANGEVKIFWHTAGLLTRGKAYFWKLRITFGNGRVKTYLESQFITV